MKEFVNELTSSAMFGLALTFLAYALCGELKKRWNNPIFNPLIFALVFICLFFDGYQNSAGELPGRWECH